MFSFTLPAAASVGLALVAAADGGPQLRTAENVGARYGAVPLHFERNQGQADHRIEYLARGNGYSLFLTPHEAVLSMASARPRESAGKPPVTVRMRVVSGNPRPALSAEAELPGKSHYLIGNDPRRWRTDVPLYGRVRYRDVYPGVDLLYYGNQKQLEYDFVVSPGVDPGIIRLEFEGPEVVKLDEDGNLVLRTAEGDLVQEAPVVYQEVEGERREVAGGYVIGDGGQVGFSFGAYDAGLPLVIDPILVYSTYLGGNGEDHGYAIAVDGSGSAYVTGYTTSTDFPILNPYQATVDTSGDVFVTKFSPSGSSLVYSTYLGGTSVDSGAGIVVDASGSAYVTGWTGSPDFPTVNPYQRTNRGSIDAFVTKLSPSGSSLVYSTYLGGSKADHGWDSHTEGGIAVDLMGAVYVAGMTESTDFPTVNPYQGTNRGKYDGFVSKLSPAGSTLVYSTYLGGNAYDGVFEVAIDRSGSAYVAGWTTSTNFPLRKPYQAAIRGEVDGFLTKLSPGGSTLVYSTYLGGSATDWAGGIAVDGSGSAYVTGWTSSWDFPLMRPAQGTHRGDLDVFVTKVSPSGAGLVYSTYLGGDKSDVAFGIAVDARGSAYVTGWTNSTNFPSVRSYQYYNQGLYDGFVSRLSFSGALVFSTYFGGRGGDSWREYASAIAVDAWGNAYVTGYTDSDDFPIASSFQDTVRGNGDGFVAKLHTGKRWDTPGGGSRSGSDGESRDGAGAEGR